MKKRPADKTAALKRLQEIPGVGKSIAQDLLGIGFHEPRELAGKDPQALYNLMCAKQGVKIDRCMLYVLRCAVYFAETKKPKPELLKWWNWSDAKTPKHLAR